MTTGVKNSVTAKVICLTGGIASGKSSAARFLKEQGAHVIDADILGHQVYDPGMPAHAQVVAAFGNEVLAADGKIDRKAVAEEVAFSRKLCSKHNWPSIDVTRRSIEETAAAVITLLTERRRNPVN